MCADGLQAVRRVYNMNVPAYNQAITVFPAGIESKEVN
ncbi:LemA family protein [Sporomusa sphaeroides]